jgi:two-component system response regulator DctR
VHCWRRPASCQGDWGLAVVLLDVRMQPLSGPVTFEQLKALGCPWPVLFLTGHGDVGTAVAAVKNGAWDFLEKPFQDNMLVDRVEQAMQAACAADRCTAAKTPSACARPWPA